jgi:hypothetical protein
VNNCRGNDLVGSASSLKIAIPTHGYETFVAEWRKGGAKRVEKDSQLRLNENLIIGSSHTGSRRRIPAWRQTPYGLRPFGLG